jgi:hypothetical protein
MTMEMVRPMLMIQPNCTTGRMSQKTSDRKPEMVVAQV